MVKKPAYKGTLIPIGGNEDKGVEESELHSLDFIDEGILSHVVRESGGTDANIVVIPTASSIPHEVGDNYLEAFDLLGCNNVQVLDIRSRPQAEKRAAISLMEQADCVMFSGGDQSRITRLIGRTKLHDLMNERLMNERFVIAGTSAGAMCMSKDMIAGGSSSESLVKGAVLLQKSKGMSWMPQLVIDSHFVRRGRFGRLAEAIAACPKRIGVGLAEDTGLIIKNGNEMTVIGSGMVLVFDPSGLSHNNHKILEEGTPMTMANLTVHVLSNGDKYNVRKRLVEPLPLDAEFV